MRTRNEILNEADAETKVRLIFEKWKFCCRNSLAKTREEELKTWKDLCCGKYRGDALRPFESCCKCKTEFLNQEVDE